MGKLHRICDNQTKVVSFNDNIMQIVDLESSMTSECLKIKAGHKVEVIAQDSQNILVA